MQQLDLYRKSFSKNMSLLRCLSHSRRHITIRRKCRQEKIKATTSKKLICLPNPSVPCSSLLSFIFIVLKPCIAKKKKSFKIVLCQKYLFFSTYIQLTYYTFANIYFNTKFSKDIEKYLKYLIVLCLFGISVTHALSAHGACTQMIV